MKSWELEDVETAARNNKDTFFIPAREERDCKKIGDIVRLHFMIKEPKDDEPRAERMWVEIIKSKSLFGKYVGVLTNQPQYIRDLNVGDEIEFYPKHIARVIVKKDDPRWIDSYEKMALVSKLCLARDSVIRFLYREESGREEDSGWRMFTGNESDEYNNDSQNIRIINVGWLLDRDPTLLKPLKGEYGSAFERSEKGQPWVRVEDWEPAE